MSMISSDDENKKFINKDDIIAIIYDPSNADLMIPDRFEWFYEDRVIGYLKIRDRFQNFIKQIYERIDQLPVITQDVGGKE